METTSTEFKARVDAELAPLRNHLEEMRAEVERLSAIVDRPLGWWVEASPCPQPDPCKPGPPFVAETQLARCPHGGEWRREPA